MQECRRFCSERETKGQTGKDGKERDRGMNHDGRCGEASLTGREKLSAFRFYPDADLMLELDNNREALSWRRRQYI